VRGWWRLEHGHRFLATRPRDELEAGAELYFGALGYRRRADDVAGLVFTRGRPWGGLWAHALRACETRLEVHLETGGTGGEHHGEPAVVTVGHTVDARGRLVLTGLDVPLDKLLRSARRRRMHAFGRWVPIGIGALLLAVLLVWVLAG
jgi:hypothetical protein